MKKNEKITDSENKQVLSAIELATGENIGALVGWISASLSIATITIKGIGLWIDERKSRKITITYGQFSVTIQGGMSIESIEEKITLIARTAQDLNREDVRIDVQENT